MTSTGAELTFWDHVTLLGALVVVAGYILFRIRIALTPGKGGCGGGCGCGSDTNCSPTNTEKCPPGTQVNLLEK